MDFYIFARDEDNALEIAGNSADREFDTLTKALAAYDEDFHEGKNIYKVDVHIAWRFPETEGQTRGTIESNGSPSRHGFGQDKVS